MMLSIKFITLIVIVSFSCNQNLWNGGRAQGEWIITHTTTTLSQDRYDLAATSSGELVFFAGGYNGVFLSDRVDIYNVTSGSWTTATLSIPRRYLAATSSQNLVFFGGGWNGTSTVYDRVDIYNTLNGSWSTATLSQPRCCLAATSVRNLVLFGGGQNLIGPSNVVDVFDVTSNRWTTATLSRPRCCLAATSVDNRYALFGGGLTFPNSPPSSTIDIFNVTSGTWNTLLSTLSVSRSRLVAVSIGTLAFFTGDAPSTACSNPSSTVVDVINVVNDTIFTLNLNVSRCFLSASTVLDLVFFGGGGTGTSMFSIVDIFNVTNGTWSTMTLSQPRQSLASTSTSDKVFFGGGYNREGISNVVDILTFIQPPPPIAIPFGPNISNPPLSSIPEVIEFQTNSTGISSSNINFCFHLSHSTE
jgi:hypothetical protein